MSKFNWDDHPIVKAHASGGSSFDWDAHPIVKPAETAPMGQTALEHFGEGASLGYLPQLQAAAAKPIYAAMNAVTGQDVQPDNYVQERDRNIKRLAQEKKDNPRVAKASELAGGLTTGIATAGVLPEAGAAKTLAGKVVQGASQGAKVGALYGAVANPGDTEGQVDALQLKERAKNLGKGAVTGALVGGSVPVATEGLKMASSAFKAGAEKIADKLKSVAEDSAVNATGATGKQASRFSDNAGRELLDRGVVRFGDSQGKIAERAADAVKQAEGQIDLALKKLDAQGVKVDANTVYNRIRDTIGKMRADSSQGDIARTLERELDDVVSAAEARGTSEQAISAAEQTKRGYNRKAGNWADPEKSMAGKEMYQAYRGAVEDSARAG
jgi:hypothetical protein